MYFLDPQLWQEGIFFFLEAKLDSVTKLLDLLTDAILESGYFVDVSSNGILTFSALSHPLLRKAF